MGDTGATFIGLNLAAITTAGESQYKGITSMTLMIPLAVMAVPMLDVVLALVGVPVEQHAHALVQRAGHIDLVRAHQRHVEPAELPGRTSGP